MSTLDKDKVKRRPSLSMLAIISFVASFVIARAFTTLNPHATLRIVGFHIHHLWFGIAMLAIGGWIGISYKNDRTDRLAAILFGAGGGIIGDEAGLLLTLKDYWTQATYSLVIIFLSLMLTLALFIRYSRVIAAEFAGLARSRLSVYFALFLTVVSVSVILETRNIIIIAVSGTLAILSCLVIVAYSVQRLRKRV